MGSGEDESRAQCHQRKREKEVLVPSPARMAIVRGSKRPNRWSVHEVGLQEERSQGRPLNGLK
jgi:hypothetical protein